MTGVRRLPLGYKSLDDELAALRALAYAQSSEAVPRAAVLRERLKRFAAQVDVVSALAGGGRPDGARRQVVKLASRVLAASPDPEVAIDLAAALWVVGDEKRAREVVREAAKPAGLDGGLFLPVIVLLFRTDRSADADRLARAFLGDLSLGLGEAQPSFDLDDIAVEMPSRAQLLEQLLAVLQLPALGQGAGPIATRLQAATLCELGRSAEGLVIAEHLLEHEPDPSVRWIAAVANDRLQQYDAALRELDQLPPSDAARPEVLAFRVLLLISLNKTKQALEVGEEAIRAHPDDTRVRLATIRAQAASGENKVALKQLDELIAAHPARGELWRAKGHLLRWQGKFPAAVKALEKAVRLEPQDARALTVLGRTLADMDRVEQGLAELDRALAVSRDPGLVLFERAQILHEHKRDVEAREVVREALDRGHQGQDVFALHGDILRALKRDDEAIVWYRKAVDTAPEGDPEIPRYSSALDEIVREQLDEASRLADKNEIDKALEVLTRLWSARELSPDGMSLRAEMLRTSGRREEAILQADEALSAGVEPTYASGTKAMALIELNRSEKGLAALEPVLAATPDYLFGWYAQMVGLDELGRVTEALANFDEHFTEATEKEWGVYQVMARSQLLMDLGRFEIAAHDLERALEGGVEADWLGPLGVAYNRLGRPVEAAEKLGQAIDTTEDEPATWPLNELGDALSAASPSRLDEATAAYMRVLERPLREPTPRDLLDRGWAYLRTGSTEASIESYRSAFTAAEDPMLSDQFRLGFALELAGKADEADAQLDRALASAGEMGDRERASAIVGEARYAASILQRDRPEAIRPATLARLESARLH